jgi:hypothetical protein
MQDDDGDDTGGAGPLSRGASTRAASASAHAAADDSTELPDFDASLWDDLMGELDEARAAVGDSVTSARPGSISPDIGLQDSDFHAFFAAGAPESGVAMPSQ